MNKSSTAFTKIKNKVFARSEFGVFIGLVLLVVVFSIASPTFLTSKNILNIIRQISFYGILAMGMTMVMVCGDIDLSVGGIYYLAAATASFFMCKGIPIWVSVIMGMLLGTLAGIANGALVSFIKLPAFIATLGIQYVVRGSALILTNGYTITLNATNIKDVSLESFKSIASGKIFGLIPMMAVIFIVVAIITYFIFHKTILGFRFRAVGCNRDAAIAAGINSNRVRIVAFAIMGFLAGLAGILMAAFLNNVQASMGDGMEMDAIAPCIIGGTSISGGRGSIIGTVIGCLIMGILKNGLVLIGVTTYLQIVISGLVILGAVSLDMLTKKNKG